MNSSRIASYFFFILLLFAATAAVFLFLPFLTPIVLAAAVAVVSFPFYKFFLRISGEGPMRRGIASFLTVLLILIAFLVPLFWLTGQLYSEIQSLYAVLTDESGRSEIIATLNSLSQSLSDSLFNVFPAYSFDSLNVTTYLRDALAWVFSNLDKIFTNLAKAAAYIFVFLLSLYYFLKDGNSLKRRFISWSPLLDTHDEYITKTLKKAIKSVFAGTIVVVIIQGILTGIGFAIFGIPTPAVWGSIAAVAALIPGIGTSLVLVPGIIYLIITGSIGSAIGLAIWGAVAVGLVDNILGPHLVNRGVNIHPFLILISVLGGLSTFGVIGFVLGPLVLAFLFALLEIYSTSFAPRSEVEPPSATPVQE